MLPAALREALLGKIQAQVIRDVEEKYGLVVHPSELSKSSKGKPGKAKRSERKGDDRLTYEKTVAIAAICDAPKLVDAWCRDRLPADVAEDLIRLRAGASDEPRASDRLSDAFASFRESVPLHNHADAAAILERLAAATWPYSWGPLDTASKTAKAAKDAMGRHLPTLPPTARGTGTEGNGP